MSNQNDRETHDVMVRPSIDTHKKLIAIAKHEKRNPGPQALKLVEEGVNKYLIDHPEVASQL